MNGVTQTSSISGASAVTETVDPLVQKFLDVDFGKVSSTDPHLADTLLMEAYNKGDVIASPKFEDPNNKGSYVFRISVPYDVGRPDTANCGMYGTPLCALVYQSSNHPLRIIPNTNDSENEIITFLPGGILVSNSGGDAGAYGISYDLVDPVTGELRHVAQLGEESDPLTSDAFYTLSAGKTSFNIADFASTGTEPETMKIKDADRLLKTVIPQSSEGAYEVTILPEETLNHPGKIYFTIGRLTFIFDGTVTPTKLIQL
jgi:hypothetical protein